jgi:formate dehydrogenase major subunit
VAREINGYNLAAGQLLASSDDLKDDGTTGSGNWLYCGSFTEEGNMATRRDKYSGGFSINTHPRWGWSWPDNRRILYNRASVDQEGQPWDSARTVIKWNPSTGLWKGDVPDGNWPPLAIDPTGSKYPFIMLPEGHGQLFSPGFNDGPFPEHYEPWESPVENLLSGTQENPVFKPWRGSYNARGNVSQYPIVATTFRCGEHWQSGQMTRNMPWLLEMVPEAYMEISRELAMARDIENGDMVTVKSARGRVTVRAMVTKRLKPFTINGRTVHQIALPYHWGYIGLSKGDSANILTPNIGDANCSVPEFKAFLCDVVREE